MVGLIQAAQLAEQIVELSGGFRLCCRGVSALAFAPGENSQACRTEIGQAHRTELFHRIQKAEDHRFQDFLLHDRPVIVLAIDPDIQEAIGMRLNDRLVLAAQGNVRRELRVNPLLTVHPNAFGLGGRHEPGRFPEKSPQLVGRHQLSRPDALGRLRPHHDVDRFRLHPLFVDKMGRKIRLDCFSFDFNFAFGNEFAQFLRRPRFQPIVQIRALRQGKGELLLARKRSMS